MYHMLPVLGQIVKKAFNSLLSNENLGWTLFQRDEIRNQNFILAKSPGDLCTHSNLMSLVQRIGAN